MDTDKKVRNPKGKKISEVKGNKKKRKTNLESTSVNRGAQEIKSEKKSPNYNSRRIKERKEGTVRSMEI